MIIWEAIVDGASRMTPEEIPTVRHWAEAKVWLETGSKDQETTSNRTSEMKQNDKREKSSVQVLFISHIWPFQLNPLPTSRTDGAKEGEGRRQGKVSRRFKPYWIAYQHFSVRVAVLILISPPKKTHNSQIRSTDTSSFKLAANEVWFGNQKVSSTLSESCRRYTMTVNSENDIQKMRYVNTDLGIFLLPNPQTNLKGSYYRGYQSDSRTSD